MASCSACGAQTDLPRATRLWASVSAEDAAAAPPTTPASVVTVVTTVAETRSAGKPPGPYWGDKDVDPVAVVLSSPRHNSELLEY